MSGSFTALGHCTRAGLYLECPSTFFVQNICVSFKSQLTSSVNRSFFLNSGSTSLQTRACQCLSFMNLPAEVAWVWISSLWLVLWNINMVQFSSITQPCPTLCNPTDCSTPGLPVHHQLPEFTQTHVHWVGDAIQPSHPLSSPSPPIFNLSQHQGLCQWFSSSHQVA